MMKKAIYPGSFDPVTNGHIDIIERASHLFDEVIVAVSTNIEKSPMFTIDERMEMLSSACSHLSNVKVDGFNGLLVRYAESNGAIAIVKGLRALSDFEFEFEMALMNRRLENRVETVFMMTNAEYSYLSSSIIKEVVKFGGSVTGLIPPIVEEYLAKKLSIIESITAAGG